MTIPGESCRAYTVHLEDGAIYPRRAQKDSVAQSTSECPVSGLFRADHVGHEDTGDRYERTLIRELLTAAASRRGPAIVKDDPAQVTAVIRRAAPRPHWKRSS